MHENAIRRTCAVTVAVGLTVVLAGATPRATAYQEAGHFYTTSVLTRALLPPVAVADAHLISFCTQLPDQSSDLDAVAVYKASIFNSPISWFLWATSSRTGSLWVRRMITVQQQLHALTGGDAVEMQRVAANVVASVSAIVPPITEAKADRSAALCALGFAVHLYGDSHAHQQMHGSDTDKMYVTGKGHAGDLTYPDLPLCAAYGSAPRFTHHCETGNVGRYLIWLNAWASLPQYFRFADETRVLEAGTALQVSNKVLALRDGASDLNHWHETEMETALAAVAGIGAADSQFFSRHQSAETCEQVVKAALADKLLAGSPDFSCAAAWARFATVVKSVYARPGALHARLDLNAKSADAAYLDSPLVN